MMKASPLDPADKVVPSSPRSLHKRATAAGWGARVTKAIGHELKDPSKTVYTIALAVARGEERIVAIWRFSPTQKKWQIKDVQDMRTGELMSVTDLKARLDA